MKTERRESINAHGETSLLGDMKSQWMGFPIDWLQARPESQRIQKFELEMPVLCMIDEGSARASLGLGNRTHHIDVRTDSIGYFAAGTFFRHSHWECKSAKRISLGIHLEGISSLGLQSLIQPSELSTALEFKDEQLAGLLRCMVREVAAGSVNGPLYAESLSVGVAARLIKTLGRKSDALMDRSKLSSAQIRHLEELVKSAMDSRITLGEMASSVGFSPAHFVRLFRNTFACTPYRYVLITRLQRARELLAQREMSLSQIANEVGFSSQSHMTTSFVATYGMTPGAIRRQG